MEHATVAPPWAQAAEHAIAAGQWHSAWCALLDAALLIRLETTQREESQRSQRWVDRQHGKIDAALAGQTPLRPAWARGL